MLNISQIAHSGLDSARIATVAFALLLGSLMIYGVAFSPIAAAHNATHDTRHSFGLPCH